MSAKHPDPTPTEIMRRKCECQAAWTPNQEWSRAGRPNRTWTAPKVGIGELEDCADEAVADRNEEAIRD